MKDDKWICHIGKEITLSSYDRLAWFVCVPKSPDGGAKYVGFQGGPAHFYLALHLPSDGSGASSLGFLITGYPGSVERTRFTGQDKRLSKNETQAHLQSVEHSASTNHGPSLSISQSISAPSPETPSGSPVFAYDMELPQTCVFFT